MKIENLVFGCRIFVDDLNDAHKRCSAVHDRSRAAKHFDALNVAEIQGRERRVECASPWHSINYQEESIEFLQAPEVRHGTGRARISAGRDFDANSVGQRAPQILRALGTQFLTGEDFNCAWNILRIFGQPRRGHFYALKNGRGFLRRLGSLRRRQRDRDAE